MKRKMVFGVLAFLLVFQAQTVFAADYNEDFVKELNRNNIGNIEKLLQRRAKEMDLTYCMYRTISKKTDCLDVLKLLVRYGADVNTHHYMFLSNGTISEFKFPLEYAVQEKLPLAIIQFLLNSGADPNKYSSFLPPLYYACSNGDMTLVNLLLDRGANGELALEGLGSRPTDNQMIQYFISRGVQVRSEAGASALRWAARAGNLDAVKLLVANGVNVNARNNDPKYQEMIPLGATAASVAYDKGNMDIYDYLKANGARDFEPRQVTQQPTQPAAPAQSTTNVYVQPTAPAQPAPKPTTPTLRQGRYAYSGTNITMDILTSLKIVTIYNGYTAVGNGSYTINGNSLAISILRITDEFSYMRGVTYEYTITSDTSFTDGRERWVRTGS